MGMNHQTWSQQVWTICLNVDVVTLELKARSMLYQFVMENEPSIIGRMSKFEMCIYEIKLTFDIYDFKSKKLYGFPKK